LPPPARCLASQDGPATGTGDWRTETGPYFTKE
jgi:hypothetical protein